MTDVTTWLEERVDEMLAAQTSVDLTKGERAAVVGVLEGAVQTVGPAFTALKAERDEARADAERLAEALQMARGFLGIGVKSPQSAAYVADRALQQHAAATSKTQSDRERGQKRD